MMDDDRQFLVVVNDEDQYSVWSADRAIPHGWQPVGNPGTEAECLARIEQLWIDMRPRSVRMALDG